MKNSRSLGAWETLHALIHDEVFAHGIIVGVAGVSGFLDPDLMKQTFDYLQSRHPLLRSHINKNDIFSFEPLLNKNVPLEIIIKNNPEEWSEMFRALLDVPFDSQDYLWRAVLLLPEDELGDCELILSLHHSICDGVSLQSLLKDIIRIYSELKIDEFIEISPLTLQPSVDELISTRKANSDFINMNKVDELTSWKYQNKCELSRRKTGAVFCSLNKNQLELLQEKCASQKISINSALNAAMICTAGQQIEKPAVIALQTPIDLRPYCKPSIGREHLGCYATITTTFHAIQDSKIDFWEIARDYRKQLKAMLKQTNFQPTNLMREDLMSLINAYCLSGDDQFTLGFGVSNAGNINLKNSENIPRIKFLYGCPSRIGGDFVILLCVCICDSAMYLTFSYTDPLLDKNWVEKFADSFIEMITWSSLAC